MTLRRALGVLIVSSAFVRLFSAYYLGLGNDEAYHSLYAAHPALGYYDHPPMMAWVEMLGQALPGAGASAWALRIGFIVLFAGSTWLLARLTARFYGEQAGFVAALVLNLTGYYGLAASTFALPDGPLLFFWLLCMDRLSVALEPLVSPPYEGGVGGGSHECLPDSALHPQSPAPLATPPYEGGSHECLPESVLYPILPWLWVGLAWGGAMLSKYHGVFLPLGTLLYLLLHRPTRRWLAQPGPYLAIGVGLLVFSPVIVWNATHGWASFLFQGGRAVGGVTLHPDQLLLAVFAQAMYLFPWIWLPLIVILFAGCRNWRRIGEHDRLLLALAVAPLGVFTLVACFRPVLPHWGLIGLVSLFPILGRKWSARLAIQPRPTRQFLAVCAAFSLVFLAFTIVEYRFGMLQRGRDGRGGLIDASRDPTLDLYGWDQVADQIHKLRLVDKPGTFVFTRYWYQSAQLAHALDGQPVLCYNNDDPRGFAFWSRPDDWVGHDGILVVVGDPGAMAGYFRQWFSRVEMVSDFWVEREGKPVRRIGLYRCIHQRIAYPFTLDRETRLARNIPLPDGSPNSR